MPQATSRTVSDRALSVMLAILVVSIFAIEPLNELGVLSREYTDMWLVPVVIVGVIAVSEHRGMAILLAVLALSTALLRLLAVWMPGNDLLVVDSVLAMATAGLLTWLLVQRVLGPGRVNWHRIQGAVAVYLIVAIIFSLAYRLVSLLADGSFAINGAVADFELVQPRLLYFSICTLTTVGYGDVVPLHAYARALAELEAVFGVLFTTVIIARLVSLELASRTAAMERQLEREIQEVREEEREARRQ
jgi:hypothetical protein